MRFAMVAAAVLFGLASAAGAAEYMEKTDFQKSRAFSPGVITQGGRIVWLAGIYVQPLRNTPAKDRSSLMRRLMSRSSIRESEIMLTRRKRQRRSKIRIHVNASA